MEIFKVNQVKKRVLVTTMLFSGLLALLFGVPGHLKPVAGFSGTVGTSQWSTNIGSPVYSTPTVADVDGDGNVEIVVGAATNNVHCLNGLNGTEKWIFSTGGSVRSSPMLYDIDGDGVMEIFFGSVDNKFYCISGTDGSEIWNFVADGEVSCTPAIGDVEGDGDFEVFFGTSTTLYSLAAESGDEIWNVSRSCRNTVILADLDDDNELEVVFNTDVNEVYCLSGVNGTQEWYTLIDAKVFDNQLTTNLALADLDDDGDLEILFLEHWYSGFLGSYLAAELHAIHGNDGSIMWSRAIQGKYMLILSVNGPVVGDVDDDGVMEAVVASISGESDFGYMGLEWRYTIISGDTGVTEETPTYEVGGPGSLMQIYPGVPAIGDIDNDGTVEMLMAHDLNQLICQRKFGSTSPEWIYSSPGSSISSNLVSSPVLADVDLDGKVEIVYCGTDGYVNLLIGSGTNWKQDGAWQQLGGSAQHHNSIFDPVMVEDLVVEFNQATDQVPYLGDGFVDKDSDVTFSITARHPTNGISTVEIFTNITGELQSSSMVAQGGDIFSCTIPPHGSQGVEIEYYFKIVDGIGTETIKGDYSYFIVYDEENPVVIEDEDVSFNDTTIPEATQSFSSTIRNYNDTDSLSVIFSVQLMYPSGIPLDVVYDDSLVVPASGSLSVSLDIDLASDSNCTVTATLALRTGWLRDGGSIIWVKEVTFFVS
ncbi:MAG: FG-GAP-like repeat-containing protein [Promethearchaeota archaeon]